MHVPPKGAERVQHKNLNLLLKAIGAIVRYVPWYPSWLPVVLSPRPDGPPRQALCQPHLAALSESLG